MIINYNFYNKSARKIEKLTISYFYLQINSSHDNIIYN